MDIDAVLENPNYYRNGYPKPWRLGYSDGQQGVYEWKPEDGYQPAYDDGHQRGLASRTQTPPGEAETPTTKENSMTEATAAPAGDVDLDALSAGLDADLAAETNGTAPASTTTSAGGFDLLEGIEDDLDKGSGKAWIPEEPGQTLIGYVVGVDVIQSDFKDAKTGDYPMLPLLDIKDRDGELWSVRGYGAVLPRLIEKNNPAVGDAIAIRFLGKEQPKNNSHQPYNNFGMKVVKPGSK